jgi:dTDP-4-dehydrorhamnose 3,5-epimerase-like enzyme
MSLSNKIKIIPRKLISDRRGWFLKVIDGKEDNLPRHTGEIYFTSALPGQAKGGHYHLRAVEWFTLISGTCDLYLVDIESGEEMVISLSSSNPVTVYVPNMIAHNFVNTGLGEYLLVAYTDVLYDSVDTIPYDFNS